MTCIAAITDGKTVWMGGDSAGVSDDLSVTVRDEPKVFENGCYLIGFTSSFRMGQVLRYTALPVPPPRADLHRFMCTRFIDAVRKATSKSGYLGKDNLGREDLGQFLVGVRGRLFNIDVDMSVGEARAKYDAVGCGSDLAKGALYASARLGEPPSFAVVQLALEAAEAGSGGVRGPFTLLRAPA